MKNNIEYKRDNKGIRISGEPKDVKWPILIDLVSSKLIWLLIIAGCILASQKQDILLALAKQLFLSG